MFCPRHPKQRMVLLLTSYVCDLCDPPGGLASPVVASSEAVVRPGGMMVGPFREGDRVVGVDINNVTFGMRGVVDSRLSADYVLYRTSNRIPISWDTGSTHSKSAEDVTIMALESDKKRMAVPGDRVMINSAHPNSKSFQGWTGTVEIGCRAGTDLTMACVAWDDGNIDRVSGIKHRSHIVHGISRTWLDLI